MILEDQVAVPARYDGIDGIFLVIGVQITDDQEVSIPTAGWIGCQPIYQRLPLPQCGSGCSCLRHHPVSGSPMSSQAEPLDLR